MEPSAFPRATATLVRGHQPRRPDHARLYPIGQSAPLSLPGRHCAAPLGAARPLPGSWPAPSSAWTNLAALCAQANRSISSWSRVIRPRKKSTAHPPRSHQEINSSAQSAPISPMSLMWLLLKSLKVWTAMANQWLPYHCLLVPVYPMSLYVCSLQASHRRRRQRAAGVYPMSLYVCSLQVHRPTRHRTIR